MASLEEIESLLARAFDDLHEGRGADQRKQRDEFVFHMTDWIDDLRSIAELYEKGDKTGESAASFLVGFLCHVIPHLNEAGRVLLGEIPNPFENSDPATGDEGT